MVFDLPQNKIIVFKTLGILVVLGSFCAFTWVFLDSVQSSGGLKPNKWTPIVLASILHFSGILFLMVLWERILFLIQQPIEGLGWPSKSSLYTAYSRSWLTRYIPGRIWSLAGRALLVNRLGVPGDVVVRSMVGEVILTYGTLLLISGTILIAVHLNPSIGVIALIVGTTSFIAGLLILQKLSTDVLTDQANFLLIRSIVHRGIKLLVGNSLLTWKSTIKGVAFYGIYSLTQLTTIVLITTAFVEIDAKMALAIAGAWGISLTVGWISILPPAGLGTRDGIAFLLFSQVLELTTASAIVIASRIMMLLMDLALVVFVEGVSRYKQIKQTAEFSDASVNYD